MPQELSSCEVSARPKTPPVTPSVVIWGIEPVKQSVALRYEFDPGNRFEVTRTVYDWELLGVDARQLLTWWRHHWDTENRLHWVRDTASREDHCRGHPRHSGPQPCRLPKRRHKCPAPGKTHQHYRRPQAKRLPSPPPFNQTRHHETIIGPAAPSLL
jgi:hypothetical protein